MERKNKRIVTDNGKLPIRDIMQNNPKRVEIKPFRLQKYGKRIWIDEDVSKLNDTRYHGDVKDSKGKTEL